MKILRPFLLALTVLLVASALKAQPTKVRVTIPFDFYAGDRIYPAGEYTLNSMERNNAVIRIDGNPEVPPSNLPSDMCSSSRPSTGTKLLFHRMGGNYFLYQIWVEGNFDGRQFPVSAVEKRMAQNRKMSDTVILAANSSKK